MSDIAPAHKALLARVLRGRGRASAADRRAAFDHAGLTAPLSSLVAKVATHAHHITDDDIAAAKASGLTEDAIFEIVVCAALGQATRQYESALAALAAATERD